MALYELVALKQSLVEASNDLTITSSIIELHNRITHLKNHTANFNDSQKKKLDEFASYYDQLIVSARETHSHIDQYVTELDNQIEVITHNLFKENYSLEYKIKNNVEYYRKYRQVPLSSEVEQIIKQKILVHTSWRYPALEISCHDGEWTKFLVAADPLYIMDKDPEFIKSTVSQFTPEYQARLRKYPLINHNLGALPKKQFAFIFSWNHLNYVGIDTVKLYLKQVFGLLRPGGTFFFSYNDGDTLYGAMQAEQFHQTYVPKGLLIPLCESFGYIVQESMNLDTVINWIELKKPGVLKTVKAHQALGEILPRKD